MQDITDFAAQAAVKFANAQNGIDKRWHLGLQRDAVEHLVKCAYYASMTADEGRFPRSTIMCYPEGAQFSVHILFEEPLEVSALEIAKLSHAAVNESHLCCTSKDGRLRLSGFHVNRLGDRPDLGYSRFRIGNPLRVTTFGPGHIEMSTGGISLVFNKGEISEESLLLYSPVMESLVARIKKEMQQFAEGTVEMVEDIIHDLALGIQAVGHGGVILFADPQKKLFFSSVRGLQSRLLQDVMYEYWRSVKELLESVGGQAGLPKTVAGAKTSNSLVVAEKTDTLVKCIQAVANLSRLDGAIALNYECKVVGFNAIITEEKVEGLKFVDCDGHDLGTAKHLLANKGSRHKSALSFVMKVPDSFAIVISQDGAISALENRGDSVVVCDRGLRLMG